MCDICHCDDCACEILPWDPLAVSAAEAGAPTAAQVLSSSATSGAITTSAIDGLDGNARWTGGGPLTFAFTTGPQDYDPIRYSGFGEPNGFLHLGGAASGSSFSANGKAILRSGFAAWDAVADIDLVETANTSGSQIAVGGSTAPSTAWAYSPGGFEASGDIWINTGMSYFSRYVASGSTPFSGSYEYLVALHEIGHALGLKHPHEGSQATPVAFDGLEFSVMSYRSFIGGPTGAYSVDTWGFPQSLMVLDIAKIQALYGADYTTLSGDTVYAFDPATGEMTVDGISAGVPGANRVLRTLWDGGGTDRIDLSAYTTDLSVNLHPGTGIDLDVGGFAQRARLGVDSRGDVVFAATHVSMSLLHGNDGRSLIENATAGSGDDTLIGNAAANVLVAGAGNDTVTGGWGADRLTLGAGADTLRDTLNGLDGDTVTDFDPSSDRLLVIGMTLAAEQLSVDASGRLIVDTNGDGTPEATLGLGLDPRSLASVSPTGSGSRIDFTIVGAPKPPTPPTPPAPPADTDPDRSLIGGLGDDMLTGGTGDDKLLLRYGDDTATGGGGADSFTLDWRYRAASDAHTIADLDFAEGDSLTVRFFNGSQTILTRSDLDAFIARAEVDAADIGADRVLTLDDGTAAVTLRLAGFGTGTLSPPTSKTFTPPAEPVADRNIAGGNDDDTLIGGAGDDQILLRIGDDTATGGGGADNFILDWRYREQGDAHTITDLDFAEGDSLMLRFFNGSQMIFRPSDLDAFIARADVDAVDIGADRLLDLDNGAMTLRLVGLAGGAGAQGPDPDRHLAGGNDDDMLTGGTGDDQILLRYGADTATGDAGADCFVFDWRYREQGDAHTIADLDFAEGDSLTLRFFNGGSHVIDSAAAFDAFVARPDVMLAGTDLTLTDAQGDSLLISIL